MPSCAEADARQGMAQSRVIRSFTASDRAHYARAPPTYACSCVLRSSSHPGQHGLSLGAADTSEQLWRCSFGSCWMGTFCERLMSLRVIGWSLFSPFFVFFLFFVLFFHYFCCCLRCELRVAGQTASSLVPTSELLFSSICCEAR